VPLAEQMLAEVGSKKAGAAGYYAGGHGSMLSGDGIDGGADQSRNFR
jgi:hypothetical protein